MVEQQLLQQTFFTALEDSDFGECREVNANSNLCSQVYGKLLQNFILPHDLLVYVQMLVPVVHTLTKLLAYVMAAQVCFYLKEEAWNLIVSETNEICTFPMF